MTMRSGRLVVAGVVGGGMLSAAIIIALRAPADKPVPPSPSAISPDPAQRAELARCRRVAGADAQCETVWEAQRRAFFGQQGTSAEPEDAQP